MARLATVLLLLACTVPLLAAAESDIEWAALEFDQEAEQAVATRGRDLLAKKYGIAEVPGAYPSPPTSPSPAASPSPSPVASPSPSPAASPSPSGPVPTPPGIVRSNTLTMTFLIVTTQGCTDALKNGWRTAIAQSLNVDPSVITMDCTTAAGGRRLSAVNVNMKGTARFNSETALEAAKKAASAPSFPNIVENNLSGAAATQTMDVKKLTVTSCKNCAVPARLPSAPIPVGKRSFKSKCNTKKPKTCTATFNYRRSNGATGYRVECTINKGKKPFKKVPAKSIKIALGVTLKFTLLNLAPNTPFTCQVSAFNSIGSSGKRAFNFRTAK